MGFYPIGDSLLIVVNALTQYSSVVSTPIGDFRILAARICAPHEVLVSFYPHWGFSAHVCDSCGFISFSLVSVGTARPFQLPLYIHICPQFPIAVRHSSRRLNCRRRFKCAILRSRASPCCLYPSPYRICMSVKEECPQKVYMSASAAVCMSLCPWACVKVCLFVYTFPCL